MEESSNGLQGQSTPTTTPVQQLPASTLSEIQQQGDPSTPTTVTHNGLWLGIVIGASIVCIIAAGVVLVGLRIRKQNTTAS